MNKIGFLNSKNFICLATYLVLTCVIEVYGISSDFTDQIITTPIIYHGRENREVTYEIDKLFHHPDHLTITLPAKNEVIILDLTLNKKLIPKGYFRKTQENGKYKIHRPSAEETKFCHYLGKIRTKANSWAAISTCDGISGTIHDGKQMHYIEKYKNEHFLKSESQKTYRFEEPNVLSRAKRNVSNQIKEPFNSNFESRYVELVLVIDNKKYKELEENAEKVDQYCKNIANIMNGIYSPLNIFIALTGVVIWTEQDEITFSLSGDLTLTNFVRYRVEKLLKNHPNDNAQLITKRIFENAVIGRALHQTICSVQYSGGISVDYSSNINIAAMTVAHMLGHNLGMAHDTSECQCPEDRCVMTSSASLTVAPIHWSSCSRNSLYSTFSNGLDHCLKNIPSSLYSSPVCGNGFVEEGEECDCGVPEFCKNPCCDAASCKLKEAAKCGRGKCCDFKTCSLKKAGIVCRQATNECDLPEYCNGEKEDCPNDVYKLNGESCLRGTGYCYQGGCGSQSKQCKLLWGAASEHSPSPCYNLNVKGSRYGNCGYDRFNTSYIKCNQEDVNCGRLFCNHNSTSLKYGLESTSLLSHAFLNSNGTILKCTAAVLDVGFDPGMVPNGSPCGENKVCVNQKCVIVESIQQGRTCPYNCYNNGFCNNRGHCHCDVGYAQPYCQHFVTGGSVDSGPAYLFSNSFIVL